MAVARIHGKVKCRRFKEKRRRAPFTKHGVTCSGLFVSCFIIIFCFVLFVFNFIFVFFEVVILRSNVRLSIKAFVFSLLPPRNRLTWLALIKGPNLSERAITADPMVRQLGTYWRNHYLSLKWCKKMFGFVNDIKSFKLNYIDVTK